MQETNSIPEAKSSAYKPLGDVEDEEGETILLVTTKLKSTPSILSSTNQGHEEREERKTPDWCASGL